jgi:hypothetical protein
MISFFIWQPIGKNHLATPQMARYQEKLRFGIIRNQQNYQLNSNTNYVAAKQVDCRNHI